MKRVIALVCVLCAAGALAEVIVAGHSGPDLVQEGIVPIKSPLVLEYKLEQLLEPVSENLAQYDLDTAVIRSFRLVPHPAKSSLAVDVAMVIYVKEGHDRTMSLRVDAVSNGQHQVLKPIDFFEAEETKVTVKQKSFTVPRDLYRAADTKIIIRVGSKED